MADRATRAQIRHRRLRRSQLVGAVAAGLAACAVWVQVGAAPGTSDRSGSEPLVASGTGPTGSRLASARVWIVQPGDTLWGIAEQLDPTGDVRPLVDELTRETHGAALQVGQRVTIP